MSKQKSIPARPLAPEKEMSEAFVRKATTRFRINTSISIALAVVVTMLSAETHGLGMAVLRGGAIGLAVWLYFFISYRRLMR